MHNRLITVLIEGYLDFLDKEKSKKKKRRTKIIANRNKLRSKNFKNIK